MNEPCWVLMLASLCASGCATVADSGGGDDNLPNAGVGPFREIEQAELGNTRVAPYALRDEEEHTRDIAVLDVDGDGATLPVWGYAARTVLAAGEVPDPARPSNEIVRHDARDGRSFDRFAVTVLAAAPGEWLGKPAALRVDAEVWLYHARADGIALAISADGESFVTLDGPVLAAAGGWEMNATPTSPAVTRSGDGGWLMFYEVPFATGSAIGEARSNDGVTWTRYGSAPAIAPSAAVDAGGAGAPHALYADSAEGRRTLYLYYGATDATGRGTVALAARLGADAAFVRADAPVFGSSGDLAPTEPWVLRYADHSVLFVTEQAGTTSAQDYPAVAVGVAPATFSLGPPDPP